MKPAAVTIAVLATGSELLSGELSEGNAAIIARQLAGIGLSLSEIRVVGDREAEIAEALQQLAGHYRVVIVTGGLGPTGDDLTARAAARASRRNLVLNDEALQQIRDYFHKLQREMPPGNEKQALLPHKCRVLQNYQGTAPGFHLRLDSTDVYFLPGVPAEMAAMCREAVIPELGRFQPGQLALEEKIVKVFGLAETQVDTLLRTAELPGEVAVGFGIDWPLVLVKLRSSGAPAVLLDRAELRVRQVLGDHVVGVDNDTLAGNVGRLLTGLGDTLAVAESCTGGMIAQLLTEVPGASTFFERGAVTYANRAKQDWLKIPPQLLAEHGAVSRECALAMARGIRQAARTDLGLAVTGIAGPDGGTDDKPVGTVFIALVSENLSRVEEFRFAGDRQRVRILTSCTALDWLRRYAITRFDGNGTV